MDQNQFAKIFNVFLHKKSPLKKSHFIFELTNLKTFDPKELYRTKTGLKYNTYTSIRLYIIHIHVYMVY